MEMCPKEQTQTPMLLSSVESSSSFGAILKFSRMSDRVQVVDKRINLAQIFATAFFRFEFALAHHDSEVANIVQLLSRQGFCSLRGNGHGALRQGNFEPRRVRANRFSQVTPKNGQFSSKHCHGSGFSLLFRSLFLRSLFLLHLLDMDGGVSAVGRLRTPLA